MIRSIRIEHLALVDAAELEFCDGLTTVTGETGAGKTLAIGAIGLVFGGAAHAGQVAPGCDYAYVEAEIDVDEQFWARPDVAALAEVRPAGEDMLVLARKVFPDGRTRALAWGRAVSRADLAAAGRHLVTIASQHDQRRLVDPAYQRQLLDGSGDAVHALLVASMGDAWSAFVEARDEHDRAAEEVASLRQRETSIQDALARIDAVAPSVDEERDLVAQRDRVRHGAQIHGALAAALAALDGDGTYEAGGGAIDAVGAAYASVASVAELDPEVGGLAAECIAAQEQLTGTAAALRSRLEALAEAPASIAQIEERLSAYDELERHFGGTVEAVCAERDRLRRQSNLLAEGEDALERARARLIAARLEVERFAEELHVARSLAASALADRVQRELAALGMQSSRFAIAVDRLDPAAHGADRVEFRVGASSRHEPGPIGRIASGGELSRIALALAIASGVAETPTLVFDEVDAGIGGTTAHAVAHTLRRLARGAQVICITHLAQITAQADAHIVVSKSDEATELRTLTSEDDVVDELCRMVGSDPSEPTARAHARSLRRFATPGAGTIGGSTTLQGATHAEP